MRINQDEFYKSQGFWWAIDDSIAAIGGQLAEENIDGPYCLNCYADLDVPHDYFPTKKNGSTTMVNHWRGLLTCSYCGREIEIKESIDAMKRRVLVQFVVSKRAEKPKISLDEPPAHVKVRDEDETYFLAAKITEKDGKRVGVVYFGEKTKDQSKKDYSQIFLDLDDEQVRFDKSNKHPQDILVSLIVEFPHGTHEMKFKGKATPPKKQ